MSDAGKDDLIAEWAAAEAPELIARAQADAREVARERLRARLVDALLAAADARLAGHSRGTPAPPPSDARVLWLYGVVPDGVEPATGNGVDGHPVHVHRHAGVNALVSDVPEDRFTQGALSRRLEDLESLEVLARAHEAVLERAMASGVVVPFRLCTIYSSPERLDAMLDRERGTLQAAFGRLDGMQEWGVKAFVREPVAAATEAPDAAASGMEYLTRKRERRDAALAGRDATEAVVAEIHARLTERAAAAALSRPQDRRLSGRTTEMILNAAYLIPADGAEAFRTVVESLGQRHEGDGIELEITGPWPPYHFVEAPEHDGDA